MEQLLQTGTWMIFEYIFSRWGKISHYCFPCEEEENKCRRKSSFTWKSKINKGLIFLYSSVKEAILPMPISVGKTNPTHFRTNFSTLSTERLQYQATVGHTNRTIG
jgi:hypothetical protein